MKRTMICALLCAVALPWAAADEPTAPRFGGLGRHRHPVTTRWKLAQRYFDQGLTLCFNFNHAEAIRSFQAAATVDPECAMAWWGIAYAHGPNINMPMQDEAVPKAWAALQEALRLRDRASDAERAYINALAKRYTNAPVADRSALDAAYADAMREVARAHPDDLDAQVLFAEALMDMAPWNYWQPDLKPKPTAREAIAVIESVLARVKAHSGADHLYIHLVEAGPNPEKGVPSADRIGRLTPKAGHLVHMASHIYVRVGRYHDAATVNERAVEVDEEYLEEVRPTGTYPGGYYPHNVHFLWYATDLEGRSRDSIAAARKVSEYTLDLRCGAIEGPRQRYLPLLALARFGKWREILQEPAPADDYPFDRAMWHYARGLAFAGLRQPSEAMREQQQFEALRGGEKVKAVDSPFFPALQVLSVAGHVLAGKVAGAQGRPAEAVEHYRRAVATEETIPYMEPPYWYYSARLTLAAGLLQAGRPSEAEREFRADLKEFPRNGWPLFGLERSLRAQGKDLEAREVAAEFQRAWKYADTPLDLQWF